MPATNVRSAPSKSAGIPCWAPSVGVPNTKLGMDIDDDKVANTSYRDTDKNVVRRATAVNDGPQRSCLAVHEMKCQLVYVLISALEPKASWHSTSSRAS